MIAPRMAAETGRAGSSIARTDDSIAADVGISNAGTATAVEVPAVVPADLLDDDEIVIAVIQPSVWHIPIAGAGVLGAIALGTLAFVWSARVPIVPWGETEAAALGAMALLARLVWGTMEWSSRIYVLTDRRAVVRAGVLRPRQHESMLRELRHCGVLASPRERALGIGTVTIATDGGAPDVVWESVRRPGEVQRLVREVAARYHSRGT